MTYLQAVPLMLGGRDLGALVVMSKERGALDNYLQQLILELSAQLSQALFTWVVQEEREAGKHGTTEQHQ
jgi:hypothetical protein